MTCWILADTHLGLTSKKYFTLITQCPQNTHCA